VSPHVIAPEADMTLGTPYAMIIFFWFLHDYFASLVEVGTRLYIAPEVQSRKRGPRNHNKADMYSLGVRILSFRLLGELLIMVLDCVL
jgi:translation initiation factor 2-alpha kinase 4